MKKIVFVCDKCKKEMNANPNTAERERPIYPYDKNWVYLYNFNIQIGEKKVMVNRENITDKHFCSESCLIAYLKDFMKEKRR